MRNAGTDAGITSLNVQNGYRLRHRLHFGAGRQPRGHVQGRPSTPATSRGSPTATATTTPAMSTPASSTSPGHSHYCGNMGGGFPQYTTWKFQHAQAWSDTATGDILQRQSRLPELARQGAGAGDGQLAAGHGNRQCDRPVPGRLERHRQRRLRGVRRRVPERERHCPARTGPLRQTADGDPEAGSAIREQLVQPRRWSPSSASSVRVSWPAGFDRDSYALTYKVIRNGSFASPVYTTSANSNWWTTPSLGFVDTGLTPGQTYSYQVVVNDSDGNTVYGATASVTHADDVRAEQRLRQLGARQRRADLLADERGQRHEHHRPGRLGRRVDRHRRHRRHRRQRSELGRRRSGDRRLRGAR